MSLDLRCSVVCVYIYPTGNSKKKIKLQFKHNEFSTEIVYRNEVQIILLRLHKKKELNSRIKYDTRRLLFCIIIHSVVLLEHKM